MQLIDWTIMLGTLAFIVAYGVWKTRHINTSQAYLQGEKDLKWWTIGLSVMATQASAITFLSTPGQAYQSGMDFAQFYIGLPIAMVILCVFVLPIYYRLNIYTAYEYLEGRFDLRTRTLTAILFLIQRGLAAGITIYAPAIILSSILDWNLNSTIFFIGLIVIFYTMVGGTKAVSVTQKQQMIVILSGMFIAALVVIWKLPTDISFSDAVSIAGKSGKLDVISFEFDLSNRYNFWSGMLGGVFLFLSYFGTDQSQVQRYLSGKSLTESRLGLLFNGIFKVPMQFFILFVGILVFVFFQFQQPPIHFNEANLEQLSGTVRQDSLQALETEYNLVFEERRREIRDMLTAIESDQPEVVANSQLAIAGLMSRDSAIRAEVDGLILRQSPEAKVRDTDYVFITFVMTYLPHGIIGLLLAVIFSAAMSSTSSELSALATTSIVDIYRRSLVKHRTDQHYLKAAKGMTLLWGALALLFAMTASLFENLIQAVNIIGSLFYGPILGIFAVAFAMKWIGGRAVFLSALLAELVVIVLYVLDNREVIDLEYLWLNPIGCLAVMLFAALLQPLIGKREIVVE